MPINILDDTALDVLATVEGDEWKRYELAHKDEPSDYSFHGLRAKYLALLAEAKEYDYDITTMPEATSSGFILYGDGGWARYRIRCTGEIVLLSNTCPPEHTEEARAAGFMIIE